MADLHVQLELLLGGLAAVGASLLCFHRILQPLHLVQAGRQRLWRWDMMSKAVVRRAMTVLLTSCSWHNGAESAVN